MAVMATDEPARLDLVIRRGSTTELLIFTFAYASTGLPYPITGWHFRLEAKDAQGAALIDASDAIDNLHLSVDGAAGTVTVVYSADETRAMAETGDVPLEYSLHTVDVDGHEHCTHEGTVTILTPTTLSL
jgi:hypothetical protein